MTHPHRLGNIICWLFLLLALAWLCLIAVPQFIDRISKHEDVWAREFGDMVSGKVNHAD